MNETNPSAETPPAEQKPELLESPVSPPAEPPLPPKPPLTEAARQREWDRLMTLANVHRVRGMLNESRKTLREALQIGGGEPRRDAEVNELLGDTYVAVEQWEEAKKFFGTAHALDPSRASAERKFARATLQVAEEAREREIAAAMLRGEMPPPGTFGGGVGKRVPGLALLLSALVPGLGQFYNGQLVKGIVCVGFFVITLGALRLSPDGDLLIRQILGLILFMPLPGSRGEASPILWMLVFLNSAIWLYSLVDAPIVAGKINKEAERFAGPRIDPATLLGFDPNALPTDSKKNT